MNHGSLGRPSYRGVDRNLPFMGYRFDAGVDRRPSYRGVDRNDKADVIE